MSEVGFEPGTFRSCVAHSIHYATETPPIPDVLLVLVAPKYINRNVTTTLQSRFTPTPPHRPHTRALFYFILFHFISFYFILFHFISFYFIFVKLLNTSHCSPKFGLYRFSTFFLQNPYLLTWRIWRKIFGLYRFFNIFLQNSYLLTWRIWRIVKTPSILLPCVSKY